MDAYSVLKAPLTTESAMKKIEDNNTLVRGLQSFFIMVQYGRTQCMCPLFVFVRTGLVASS